MSSRTPKSGVGGRDEETPPRGLSRPLETIVSTREAAAGGPPERFEGPGPGMLETLVSGAEARAERVPGPLETRVSGPGAGPLETRVSGPGAGPLETRVSGSGGGPLETRVSGPRWSVDEGTRAGEPAVDRGNLETRASEAMTSSRGASLIERLHAVTQADHDLDAGTRGRPGLREREEPRAIGRYMVISRLAAGGMGVVYRAYDPDLDRRVAIKLLRGHGAAEASARLLREAQAMARLSHPAVVPVFDVGLVDDQVFVAMDFIDGQDLAAWIAAGPHPWREVVDLFLQAGAGLAAAHAVGLIHRDFKPDNVLLSRDPATQRLRAQVADFGLARMGDEPEGAVAAGDLKVSRNSALSHRLTQMGSIIGTPAYMSPEQHAGLPVDARTDQFSFAVAFYEALYQRRPFDGQTLEALAEGARSTRRDPPPSGVKVPAWLHRIVLRAMHPDREARYPGMEALLRALELGLGRGRRRSLVAGGALMAAALGLGVGLREAPPPRCAGGPAKLASAWDHGKRSAAEAAFRATGKPYAADAWTHAEARVDAYGSAWIDAYTDACEATQVRGDLSGEVMDLRMVCLDQRLQDLRVLTDMFKEADVEVVKRAVEAASELGDLAPCADVVALRAGPAAPPAAIAGAVEGVRARLSEGRSLNRIRKDKEALALLEPLAGEAEALGHAPTLAEVLLALADAQADSGADEVALQSTQRALWTAIASHHDAIVDDALIQVIGQVGHKLGRREAAQAWIDHADAVVVRDGDPPKARARLLGAIAIVEVTAGRHAEAEAALRRAIELREAKSVEPLRLIDLLNTLGVIYVRTGRYSEAAAPVERAIEIVTRELGPSHPDLVNLLNTLALIHERQARYEPAIAALRRTLELLLAASGPEHPNVGLIRQNLGGMLMFAGDRAGAREELTRSLAILEASVGGEHPALGGVLTFTGDLELEEGHLEAARAAYQRAIDIRSAALGADHPDLALSLVGLARVDLAAGDDEAALAHVEHALRNMSEGSSDPGDLGIARFVRAQALWKSDPAAARASAEAALVKLREAGVTVDRQRLAAEAWIGEHPLPATPGDRH